MRMRCAGLTLALMTIVGAAEVARASPYVWVHAQVVDENRNAADLMSLLIVEVMSPRTERPAWTCSIPGGTVDVSPEGECAGVATWYQGPGSYEIQVGRADKAGIPAGFALEMDDHYTRYNVSLWLRPDGRLLGSPHIRRYMAAPQGMEFTPAWDPSTSAQPVYLLTNNTDVPFRSDHEAQRFVGIVLRWEDRDWKYYRRGEYNPPPKVRGRQLKPGETLVVTEHEFVGARPSVAFVPGRYRFVVSFPVFDRPETRRGATVQDVFQVHSEFTVAPGDAAMAPHDARMSASSQHERHPT